MEIVLTHCNMIVNKKETECLDLTAIKPVVQALRHLASRETKVR